MAKKKVLLGKLILAILICESAGIIGSVFTISAISTWYVFLNKPFFNPPAWIFGPVWTILYFLMGISLYLVWNKKGKHLTYFWVQLALNALWSIIFFGLHLPILALVEVIALLVAIILTIKSFYKVKKTAAYILLPYLAWVSFATILNFAIILLNF